MSNFRRGEWVIVRALNDGEWPDEDQWVIGERAMVHGDYNADEVMVWLPSGEPIGQHDLWILDAHLLETTGEVDGEAEHLIHDEASGSQLRKLGREPLGEES